MSSKGYKHSEEAKERIRLASIGRKHPPRSDEWRKKQRLAHSGKKIVGRKAPTPFTKEHKLKISVANKGRIRTPEQRRKLGESRKGEKSHFWKGGISTANELARKSVEYAIWREAVFKRDNYTCQDCGAHSGHGKRVDLHADHRKPWALFPELRFAIDNGKTLCVPCHKKTPTFGGKLLRYTKVA
jgi:hypothetical protein